MAESSSIEDRIRTEFTNVLKEYTAYDRTLDALAALSFVLQNVKEIADETTFVDFRPKLEPADSDPDPYTPDGLIVQKPTYDSILELKTSWNEKDVQQIVKYGKSQKYFRPDGSTQLFAKDRSLLLGYQNAPGEANLNKLFDAWDSCGFGFPLVVFRYSLEQAAEGDRIFFLRVPYSRNGLCPSSSLGKAINSVRGFPVSVDKYKVHRPRFHRANDQVISSYAAVLWWTTYARYYLTEEQKIEMAERGRLSSPLVIPLDRLDQVPTPAGVEVPLGPKGVRRALEFLRQAGLVVLKKRAQVFEIELKEDRYVRLPQGSPVSGSPSQLDISTKILARWATHKVKKPVEPPHRKPARSKAVTLRKPDERSGWLFPEDHD